MHTEYSITGILPNMFLSYKPIDKPYLVVNKSSVTIMKLMIIIL